MKSFFSYLLFLASLPSALSLARTQVIETYGDSLTTGFLANTNLEDPLSVRAASRIRRRIVWSEGIHRLTGRRPERPLKRFEYANLAWPAVLVEGWDQLRSKKDPALRIVLRNYAVSGATSADLIDEMSQVPADPKPLVAFFFIGHNDLSRGYEKKTLVIDRFLDHYRKALKHWDAHHHDSRAFLLPVGNLPAVYEAVDDYSWPRGKRKRVTCDEVWRKYFPYWHFFPEGKRGVAQDFIELVGAKIDAMNSGISKLARDFRSENSNEVIYLEGLLDRPMKPIYFAADCFHLSEAGQRMLGRVVIAWLKKYERSSRSEDGSYLF